MTSRCARLLISPLVALTLLSNSAFAQGSKMQSPYDPVVEADKDRPDKRADWMSRGREAPKGQSAAALRLRAHRQKMALRAQRAEGARKAGIAAANAPAAAGWVALGPAPLPTWSGQSYGNVTGRITSVAMDPSDTSGNTVYVGGAYGGVWKSTNAAGALGSVTWLPVTDQQASLATGAVSVQPVPTNPIVLVGTGEPNNAIDSYYGVGILRSTNGGTSWNLISTANNGALSFAGLGVAKFAWSTANTSIVVAATATTAKGFVEGNITANTNRGLYRSADGGQTWTFQALPDGSPISATDVVYDATAGKFVAIVRSHGLYTSVDGTNWTRPTNQPTPLTATCSANANCPMYRGQLAVVPGRDELYLWFIGFDINNNLVNQGIWRSVSGGTWTRISEAGLTACPDGGGCFMDQTFYNMEVAGVPNGASTTDVYVGGVNLFKCKLPNSSTSCSTLDANFSNQWINLTHVYGCNPTANISHVHPDEHGLDFRVIGGKAVMYFGNDGGVYRALDGFAGLVSGTCTSPNTSANIGFENLNKPSLGSLTQFVSFSIDRTNQDTILGGTQDNGSPATTDATAQPPTWFTANFGDGGPNAINPTNALQWFTSYPPQQNVGVAITACNRAPTCDPIDFTNNLVVSSSDLGGDLSAFYTPYILDPQNSGEMLVGTCRAWRGSSAGTAFTALSPNFDTGATGNAGTCTGGEFNLVRSLAAGGPTSGGLSNVVYATSEGSGPNCTGGCGGPFGGEIWSTTNAATTLMTNRTGTINPSNYVISSVAIDGSVANGQTAFVGIMGFGGGHVFKTTNAGSGGSWTDWTGTGLPDSPVNALLVDSSVSPSQVYAGTDVGVFVSSTTSAAWTEVGPDAQPGATGYLPNVPVSAIRLFNNAKIKKLRVSTYGRGIWEFNLNTTPDYTNAISDSPKTIFPTQTATFNGKLTAVNGYNSPVNLSCTGTPPGTCTITPTQKTPTDAGADYTVDAAGVIGDYNFNAHAVGTDANTVTHDAPITLHVVDFAVGSPGPISVHQGLSSTASFTVTAQGSFAQAVTLSCTNLPAGTTCGLSQNPVNPTSGNPVSVTLTVSATAGAQLGTQTVTIQGTTTSPAATRTATFSLTVLAAPDFDWTGSGTHTVLAGQRTQPYNFTATPNNGDTTFAADVTFSCSGLPDSTAACVFDTGQLDPTKIAAGSGATTVHMTITTTGPNQGQGGSNARLERRADNRAPWLPLAIPVAGVFFVGIAAQKLPRRYSAAGLLVALVAIGLLLACGGGGNTTPPPPPPVSVSINPSAAVNLYANEAGNQWPSQETQEYTATVSHASNTAVTWSLRQNTTDCTTNPVCGTLSATTGSPVTYTAPAAVPNPSTVTVRATAQADTTKSASDTVNILQPTALGNFTVTVTATEGVKAHSQQGTLTVQ